MAQQYTIHKVEYPIVGGKAIFSIYIDCQLGISSLKVIHNIVPLAD